MPAGNTAGRNRGVRDNVNADMTRRAGRLDRAVCCAARHDARQNPAGRFAIAEREELPDCRSGALATIPIHRY